MNVAAADVPEPVFTISGAAHRLGIPAATLRTWERRHGIGPSGRSLGGHRRYTGSDLARLRAMRTLVETGVPPAQAARLAALAAGNGGRRPPRQLGGAIPAGTAAAGDVPPALVLGAAQALDAPLLRSLLSEAFARHGVIATWQQVAVPVLRELGERAPRAVGHGAVEHVLSGCVLAALLQVITEAPPPRAIRPVLLTCAEDEQHLLPVYALQAELAGRGVDVRQLGGQVPRAALAHAISAVQPAAVFIWAQVAATARTALLHGLPPVDRIVLGGPGWDREPALGTVRLVGSLDQAARLLADCAFAATGPACGDEQRTASGEES